MPASWAASLSSEETESAMEIMRRREGQVLLCLMRASSFGPSHTTTVIQAVRRERGGEREGEVEWWLKEERDH